MTPEESAERLANAIGRNVELTMEVDDLKSAVTLAVLRATDAEREVEQLRERVVFLEERNNKQNYHQSQKAKDIVELKGQVTIERGKVERGRAELAEVRAAWRAQVAELREQRDYWRTLDMAQEES